VAAADPAGPRPNAVTSQRPGQSDAADGKAEPNRAHLAAAPIAPAEANSAAAVTPPVLGSGYAVQVTSERSESGAQAAFRALQAKYPNQLRGRQATIRRADLGAGGIYYRALVGPFASAEKAAKLCSGLKAAGGDCIILKN
jgi:cell division protein FtsN